MPVDLRPLSLGELFDRAFMLYRRHFWSFVGITAVPGVFALLLTLLQQAFTSATLPSASEGPPDPEAAVENLVLVLSLFAGTMIAFVIYWVVYMIALGATTFAVSEIYLGRSVTIPFVYGRMRGRIGALILLLLVMALRLGGLAVAGILMIAFIAAAGRSAPVIAGLLIFLLALVLFAIFVLLALRYSLAIPAMVVEGLGAGDAIRRSVELTRDRLGRVFLMVLCATLITYAALVLFQGPFFAAAMMAGFDTARGFWLNILGAVFGTIGTTLTAPFLIVGLALIYYDARVREEGLDLDLSLAALEPGVRTDS